jgi:hypothetical protein
VEHLLVSPEEEIQAVVDALVQAVEREDRPAVEALLLDPADFSGPHPIRSGDRTAMLRGLELLGEKTRELQYISRAPEVRIAGRSASHTSEGLIRFKWGDALVVHRAKIEITLMEDAPDRPEGWCVRRVDVLELRRGIR